MKHSAQLPMAINTNSKISDSILAMIYFDLIIAIDIQTPVRMLNPAALTTTVNTARKISESITHNYIKQSTQLQNIRIYHSNKVMHQDLAHQNVKKKTSQNVKLCTITNCKILDTMLAIIYIDLPTATNIR